MIKHALDGHLDLELGGRLQSKFDALPHPIHDQIGQLKLCFVQMHEVRTVEQVVLLVALLSLLVLHELEIWQRALPLLLNDESDPVVHHADENDEDGRLVHCSELPYLAI